jgi:hypothetical protein
LLQFDHSDFFFFLFSQNAPINFLKKIKGGPGPIGVAGHPLNFKFFLKFFIFLFFIFNLGRGHFGEKKEESKWSNCNNLKVLGGGGGTCHVLNIGDQSAN